MCVRRGGGGGEGHLRDKCDLVAQRHQQLCACILEGPIEHLAQEGDVLWRHLVLERTLDEASLEQHKQRPLVATEGCLGFGREASSIGRAHGVGGELSHSHNHNYGCSWGGLDSGAPTGSWTAVLQGWPGSPRADKCHEVGVRHAIAQCRRVELVRVCVRVHVDEEVEEPLR